MKKKLPKKKLVPRKKLNAKTRIAYPPKPILFVRVTRFNPLMDFTPRSHEYSITPTSGESVLELLYRIKHTQDGSLTFRGSCGYGGCGTCGVKANGQLVLACVTQVSDLVDSAGNLGIEPMHENVLKDLAVDETQFFAELLKIKPWMVQRKKDERRNHKMGIHDVEKLGKTPQCVLCGICNASVESEKKGELGPASFVRAYRYIQDIRDGNVGRLKTLASEFSPHYDLEKANACPRDINPGKRINELMEMNAERLKKEQSINGLGKRT